MKQKVIMKFTSYLFIVLAVALCFLTSAEAARGRTKGYRNPCYRQCKAQVKALKKQATTNCRYNTTSKVYQKSCNQVVKGAAKILNGVCLLNTTDIVPPANCNYTGSTDIVINPTNFVFPW